MSTLHRLQVTCVRPVARHQADTEACLEVEEDCSGNYIQVNTTTFYGVSLGRYLSLSREGMARAIQGEPLRVSPRAFS